MSAPSYPSHRTHRGLSSVSAGRWRRVCSGIWPVVAHASSVRETNPGDGQRPVRAFGSMASWKLTPQPSAPQCALLRGFSAANGWDATREGGFFLTPVRMRRASRLPGPMCALMVGYVVSAQSAGAAELPPLLTGMQEFKAQRFSEAVVLLRRAVKQEPGNP